jgi:hypothetical protein
VGFILFVGVGLGFFASVVVTLLFSRRLLATMSRGIPSPGHRRSILRGAVGGVVIAFVPALLLGTVIGGTLGGNYAGTLAAAHDSGVLIGVSLGVFAVASIVLCGSVAVGAWIGRWLAGRDTPH